MTSFSPVSAALGAQFQVARHGKISPSRGHYIGYEISSMMSIGSTDALREVSYDSHANAGHLPD
jgi:hypothetical protein